MERFDLNTNIIKQADDFAEAYYRCIKGENPKKVQGGVCYHVVNIPAIVNAAFACELYLKSMIFEQIQDHDLQKLFSKLDVEAQTKIKNSINAELIGNPIYNFEMCLEKAANVFVEWRYIFEEEHTEGFYGSLINQHLTFFSLFLKNLQKEVRENYSIMK